MPSCPDCGEPLRIECSSCSYHRAAPSPAASEDAQGEAETEDVPRAAIERQQAAEEGAVTPTASPASNPSEDAEAAFEAWCASGYQFRHLTRSALHLSCFAAGRASAPGVKPYDISAANERQSDFYRSVGGRRAPEDEAREAAQGEEESDDA